VETINKIKAQQGQKAAQLKSAGQATTEDLALINNYALNPLTIEQVYTTKLSLCDNEIDRQYDLFTPNALKKLAELYIGKTVMFNHSWNAKDQTARIYKADVELVNGQMTEDGRPYMRLVAMAYMLNLPCNEDIIASINGGILKEGSVSFRNNTDTCSVCGCGYYSGECPHYKGRKYTTNGVEMLCYTLLDDITDVFEFSFVAVPAQPKAGVTKGFKDGRALSAETKKKLKAARELRVQAMDCENQARVIEDELVGQWEDEEETEIEIEIEVETDEDKAFKAQIKLYGGN
jgi:hypothetical protein